MPGVGVYFVKFSSIAAWAAVLMAPGVGKSGSPAPKSITSIPARRSLSTVAVTCIVAELAIRFVRSASRVIGSAFYFLPLSFCLRPFAFFLLPSTFYLLSLTPAPIGCASGFSRSRSSTRSGTRPLTRPPSEKTSLISRELMYVYFSAGIMNTVSMFELSR